MFYTKISYLSMIVIHQALSFITADTSLGRASYSLLSDQDLMEMLIEGFTEEAKESFQDPNGMFTDVCDWKGVECDDQENVVNISNLNATGTMALSFIPPKVTEFQVFLRNLSGTLETSTLPEDLEVFKIGGNNFHGTLDLARLPERFIKLSAYRNAFTGSAHLDKLPNTMTHIWLFENKMSGTLCLTSLPPQMEYIDLSDNAFTGDFCLGNVTDTLYQLYANENRFSEIAIVPSSCSFVHLADSGVKSVVNLQGVTHADENRILSS